MRIDIYCIYSDILKKGRKVMILGRHNKFLIATYNSSELALHIGKNQAYTIREGIAKGTISVYDLSMYSHGSQTF